MVSAPFESHVYRAGERFAVNAGAQHAAGHEFDGAAIRTVVRWQAGHWLRPLLSFTGLRGRSPFPPPATDADGLSVSKMITLKASTSTLAFADDGRPTP
jgi:hypothetical protein